MIEDLWYRNAVVYSLNLETFMDGNGDGCGDFEGLIRRLDYLDSLGVDAVWLGPFQPSPGRDHGYDVSDFYGVDPRYGTPGDFVELIHQAHSRGIRVLMDLVVNHTSDRHPWFQDARSDPRSRYRDWYVWSAERPRQWDEGMVFPGVQEATWTRDEAAGAYYYHRFYDFQPDLNMDNPDVRTEVRRIMGYWLQMGVAGFRMDAVPFVIEGTHDGSGGDVPMHFDYLRQMRGFLQWRSQGAILLGEANVLPPESRKYFGQDGDGIHMMFNFFVNQHLFYALASGDTRPLVRALNATRALPPAAQWAQFLRNHDELDLGRLTEEQRGLVFDRFGPEPGMQLYGRGIRRRLAGMLGGRARLELAYSLLFSLPGTPVLRYGDEIGMGEDLSLKERDAVRTPMQWSHERNAGFSTADTLVKPVIADGPFGCAHVNVESQRRDPGSLLNWMVGMIRLRKECPEIGWGTWTVLPAGDSSVLALCYSWRGNHVVVLHNFAEEPREARFRLKVEGGGHLASLLSAGDLRAKDGVHRVTLPAYGYGWYRVGGFGYALREDRDGGAGVAW